MTALPVPLDPALDLLAERAVARVVRDGLGPQEALDAEGGRLLGRADQVAVLARVAASAHGLGPLEPLLADPAVTDVLVSAGRVWVDRGEGARPVDLVLPPDVLRRLALRLVAPTGRRLDDAQPWVDATLPGGLRVHVLLPPLAVDGVCLSLRVPRRTGVSLEQLGLHPAALALLRDVLDARLSFLVSGGTGTGKTTLLSALLGACDPGQRLVVVEDATELAPDHPHVVRLQARAANVEGAGAVSLRDLVRQALRMRPDRLLVGEVRGAEVVDLLAALNTGHEGGGGTLHANAVGDVPARVEALAVAAGLDRLAAHSQLAAGVDVVLHLARDRSGARHLAAVGVPVVKPGGLVAVEAAWTGDASGAGAPGVGWARLQALLAERRG